MLYNNIKHVINHFRFEGEYEDVEELLSGNINSTYRLTYRMPDGKKVKYVLQKINTVAFRQPDELMKNVQLVIDHITAAMARAHIDPSRRILEFIPTTGYQTTDSPLLYRDDHNDFWRADVFIDNATAYDQITEPHMFYEAGRGFGEFQKYLSDFPADKLVETIPDFHNTKKRFYKFVASVSADSAGRAGELEKEIDFFFDRRKMMSSIVDLLDEGKIPLRVTHNDTKLNNVMIDDDTGEALCVIDLDTVMPGSSLYDYGDAIRYGASTAAEDEPDLSKIGVDMELFRQFTDGFISEVKDDLTRDELLMLPLGIKVINCELAMRFLTDYLDGDVYFKVNRPQHNLIRARAQMRLLECFEEKYDEMCDYVGKLVDKE